MLFGNNDTVFELILPDTDQITMHIRKAVKNIN